MLCKMCKLEYETIDGDCFCKVCREIVAVRGLKSDNEKIRWDLVPLDVIEQLAKVYTFGSKKYTENSWQQLENSRERYFSALMRHLTAWRNGEQFDGESKLNHLAHVLWNVVALLWFDLHNKKDK